MSKEKCYKFCQSCGVPFNKDPQGGGTEADGQKSCVYCSYCYLNGEFTQPEMTMKKMQKLVDEKLREMKSNFLIRFFAKKQIPRLLRWKK